MKCVLRGAMVNQYTGVAHSVSSMFTLGVIFVCVSTPSNIHNGTPSILWCLGEPLLQFTNDHYTTRGQSWPKANLPHNCMSPVPICSPSRKRTDTLPAAVTRISSSDFGSSSWWHCFTSNNEKTETQSISSCPWFSLLSPANNTITCPWVSLPFGTCPCRPENLEPNGTDSRNRGSMLSLRKQVKMHWKKDRQGNHVAVPLTYCAKNGTSKQPKSKKNPMISNISFMLVCRSEIRKVLEKTLPHDLISSHIILFMNSPCSEMIIKTQSPIFRHRFFNQATSPLRGLRVSFHNRCSAALMAPCCGWAKTAAGSSMIHAS